MGGRKAEWGARGATASAVRLRPVDPAARRVLVLVAAELGVSTDLMLQRERGCAEIAHARQVAMYLCNVTLGRRLASIGRMFGRDRSTVSYACAKIEDMRDDPVFDARVCRLEEALDASPTPAMEVARAAA